MPLGLNPRSRSHSGDSARAIIEAAEHQGMLPGFSREPPSPIPNGMAVGADMTYRPVSRSSSGPTGPVHEHGDLGEINELLDLNPSVYDLTIQYFCLAFHPYGGDWAILNLLLVLALEVLNVVIQMVLLFEVQYLIAEPAIGRARSLYDLFTKECHVLDAPNEAVLAERFANWDADSTKKALCRFPLNRPVFFFLIVLIWTFFLCHETKQTFNLTWTTLRLASPEGSSVAIWKHDENFIITHMSTLLKIGLFVTVYAPKFVIGIILWLIGARWLTATPGVDNLMLNSLALAFICEVDELIYRTCMSEVAKSCLARTKLPLPPFRYTPSVWGPVETVLTCLGCVLLAYLYMTMWQTAIPDYRWDLEELCLQQMHEDSAIASWDDDGN